MKSERLDVAGLTLGQYAIGERIGSGGMATVYRGMQSSLNREVAIKVLPLHFSNDPTFVERFKQEAISIASLRHPNILAVFDYGEQNGIIYMVTEYVAGGTLEQKLGRPLDLDDVLEIAAPLASAIDHAHARGIIHRDLKPANVLLTPDGQPILSDFGLARLLEGARLTRSGSALGTPEYMSPEQATGEEVGPAADIYAFGVLLYEMLTGEVPFSGDTPVAVILAHLQQPPPPLRKFVRDMRPEVEAVILTCLEKDPAQRYRRAIDVVRALEVTRGEIQKVSYRVESTSVVDAEARLSKAGVEAHQIEYGQLRVDFGGERLLWSGQGIERAREILRQRLDQMKEEGWEIAGSLRDPGVLTQGTSLRGPTVRGAVLYLRRVRP